MNMSQKDFTSPETCMALPGLGSTPARLTGTLWHGTRLSQLPGILEAGLLPEANKVGHTCLTRDPAIALFYARLEQSLWGDAEGSAPVLIRIDAASLTPEALVPETGSVTISAYGETLPGRDKASLRRLRHDWLALFEATDCVGVSQRIHVEDAMIDRRMAHLTPLSVPALVTEGEVGSPEDAHTRALCDMLRAENALEVALAA